jgi:hypothetical protein
MPITLDTPISVPAKEYDKLWLNLLIRGVPGEASATISLQPYSDAGGVVSTAPVKPVIILIKDLFAEAATPDGQTAGLPQAIGAVLQAVSAYAKLKGKI